MYDGVADFPQWLANPVAVLNAVAGFQYIHGTYLAPNGDDPAGETPYGYTPQEVQDTSSRPRRPTAPRRHYCQHVDGSDTIYVTLAGQVPAALPAVRRSR